MHAHIRYIDVSGIYIYIADSCFFKCCIYVINKDGKRWYKGMNVEDVKL